jgi:hypothetical protein
MNTYRVYDGNGYMVASVEAYDNEGAEKAATDAGYGEGYKVGIAYINLGTRMVSLEAYLSM